MEAKKFDSGKPRFDLIPPEALYGIAAAFTYGVNKYKEERNWERGTSWGRWFGAAMRHLWSWWMGEESDPESGLHHLDHAACCVCVLLAYSKRSLGKDDRKLEQAIPKEHWLSKDVAPLITVDPLSGLEYLPDTPDVLSAKSFATRSTAELDAFTDALHKCSKVGLGDDPNNLVTY